MNGFSNWLATTPLGSAFKVFLAYVFGAALLEWTSAGSFVFDNWQVWVIGALAIAIVPIINWLNPNDTRYGRGAE
jgi:hypothetical protein